MAPEFQWSVENWHGSTECEVHEFNGSASLHVTFEVLSGDQVSLCETGMWFGQSDNCVWAAVSLPAEVASSLEAFLSEAYLERRYDQAAHDEDF